MTPRPTFKGAVKGFCPCDAGHPEDCNPEEWEGAHAASTCYDCGAPRYQHQGLTFCPELPAIGHVFQPFRFNERMCTVRMASGADCPYGPEAHHA